MPAVNSALSCFLLCFAITSGLSLTLESPERNASKADSGRGSAKIPPEAETAGSSKGRKKWRILDGTTDRTNATSYVTVQNEYSSAEADVSTTPKSLADSTWSLLCPPSTKIMDFKPSTHIGAIDEYETRKSGDIIDKHHLDNSKHVKFDNTVRIDESLDTDRVRVATSSFRGSSERSAGAIAETNKIPVKFFETDGRYGVAVPVDLVHHQHRHEYYEPHEIIHSGGRQQMMSHEHDENVNVGDANDHNQYQSEHLAISQGQEALATLEYPSSQGYVTSSRPVVSFVRTSFTPTPQEALPNYYEHKPYNVHSADYLYSVHAKPSKLHDDTATPSPNVPPQYQLYEYTPVAEGSSGAIKNPQVQDFHHQTGPYRDENHQQAFAQEHSSDQIGKPETLFYTTSHRESAVTRMRKFPYQFYEPSVIGHQDNEYHYGLHEIPYPFPAKERRVSPWKKIFHLIGAFLPLGLLLATLKPNVVKIENTTQPNIVLSKLRVVDLPAEHKRGGLADNHGDKFHQDTCDDRFICELIVSGSEPSSNLLHNVLWNLTNKSTEEEAHKHGLHEIFSAAKRKDCSSIDC